MPLYTADALVLRTYKLGEADRIVVFLTRDRGKKRGVAKGARRPRSRFTGALEPLTEVSVAYFEKERRELVGLNYAETRRSPLVLGSPDARILSELADLVVLVAGYGKVTPDKLEKAIGSFPADKVAGVVFNEIP